MLRKKYFQLIIPLLNTFAALCQSGTVNNPATDETINFSFLTKKADKQIPFDKPFLLSVDKIDLSRVEHALAYFVYYEKGKRVMDTNKKYGGDPDINLHWDTAANKLLLFFPALRPNINFDISIHQTVSPDNIHNFLLLAEAVHNNNPDAANMFSALQKHFEDSLISPARFSITDTTFSDFTVKSWPKLDAIVTKAADSTNYITINTIPLAKIISMENLADAAMIKLNRVIILASSSAGFLQSISNGHGSLVNLYAPPAKEVFYDDRIANLKASVGVLQSLQDSAMAVYVRNGNTDVKDILDALKSNIDILQKNTAFLKGIWKQVSDAINAYNYEAVWLVGTTESMDLATKGGSLMSTEIGLTNILVKNNADETKYIPRLYWGLNIFFRPVDRNAVIKYLPRRKQKFTYPYGAIADDELSARQAILQHLTLSIGLTLGALDQPDFDNFYNSMSLTVGPSYRFARAFRFSAGLAVLKRKNPNPLFTDKKTTTGAYASFSVDFDLVQSIKSFVNLIFK